MKDQIYFKVKKEIQKSKDEKLFVYLSMKKKIVFFIQKSETT